MKKVILGVIILCFGFASCFNEDNSGSVLYKVTCDKPGVEVEFNAGTKVRKGDSVNSSTWEYSYEGQYGETVSIWAKSKSLESKITVQVFFKGVLFDTSSNMGDYPEVSIDRNL